MAQNLILTDRFAGEALWIGVTWSVEQKERFMETVWCSAWRGSGFYF